MQILGAVAACFLALELFVAFARSTTGNLSPEEWPCYYVTKKDEPPTNKLHDTSYRFYWIQGTPVQAWYSQSRKRFLVYHPAAEHTATFEGPFGPNFGLLSVLKRLIRSRKDPAFLPKQDFTIWSDKSGWWRAFALYEECCRLDHKVSLCVVVHGEQTATHLQNIWYQVSEPKDKGLIGSKYHQPVEELDVIAAIKTFQGGKCDVGKFLRAFPLSLTLIMHQYVGSQLFRISSGVQIELS